MLWYFLEWSITGGLHRTGTIGELASSKQIKVCTSEWFTIVNRIELVFI